MTESPAAEAARNRVLDSLRQLDATRRRVEATSIGSNSGRTSVSEALLIRLSISSRASAELRAFAAHVEAGATTWDRIEVDGKPVPPEVAELRSDPRVDWPAHWPLDRGEEPYRIPWQ